MNAETTIRPMTLENLRVPFSPNQISKLPKETKGQREARERDRNVGVRCKLCGGWHHKDAVHLDYVGHAALTDRLLDTDPEWDWQPLAYTPEGLPAFDDNGGLWIKLTVLGKTRLGYGSADGKRGGDAIKEIIGDALRNAAMRFGAALDLWHKGDLHAEEGEDTARQQDHQSKYPRHDPDMLDEAQLAHIQQLIEQAGVDVKAFCNSYKIQAVKFLPSAKFGRAVDRLKEKLREKQATKKSNDAKHELAYIDDDVPF